MLVYLDRHCFYKISIILLVHHVLVIISLIVSFCSKDLVYWIEVIYGPVDDSIRTYLFIFLLRILLTSEDFGESIKGGEVNYLPWFWFTVGTAQTHGVRVDESRHHQVIDRRALLVTRNIRSRIFNGSTTFRSGAVISLGFVRILLGI